MGARRKAREAAVQLLYQVDMEEVDARTALGLYWDNLGVDAEARAFASELFEGWHNKREPIDECIRTASRHWRLERMSRVDRNVIRLATYELMERPDIPVKVTLNEAIELAKRFGHEDSAAFVNGVVDKIASILRKG